jgi:hypothetical protein
VPGKGPKTHSQIQQPLVDVFAPRLLIPQPSGVDSRGNRTQSGRSNQGRATVPGWRVRGRRWAVKTCTANLQPPWCHRKGNAPRRPLNCCRSERSHQTTRLRVLGFFRRVPPALRRHRIVNTGAT